MKLSFVLPFAFACLAACAVAGADRSSSSSESNLSGAIGTERACAVARAYHEATLAEFETPPVSEIPANVTRTAPGSTVGRFHVAGIGVAFAAQVQNTLFLFDQNGALLAKGSFSGGSVSTGWYGSDDQFLNCQVLGGAVDGGVIGGGDDDDDDDDDSYPPTSGEGGAGSSGAVGSHPDAGF